MDSDSYAQDAVVQYYDGDFPWSDGTPATGADDDILADMRASVHRYRALATRAGGAVLDLCCGTGRIAIPLARAGLRVTGVDISDGMLAGFRRHLEREDDDTRARIELVQADIRELALEERDFGLAIIPYSSLLLIDSLEEQRRAVQAVARHLGPEHLFALDIINPFCMRLRGESTATPMPTRINVRTGNEYTRFSQLSPLDESGRQRVYGWYSERAPDGAVVETPYSFWWRPLFPWEIERLLRESGFTVLSATEDYGDAPYTARSRNLFLIAKRAAIPA